MHELNLSASQSKAEIYASLLPQIRALIADEPELQTAALANTCAALKEAFGWLWVGFYMVNDAQTELHLAPFQGPVACTRIPKGRGVCGQAWAKGETIVVQNVNEHPDHIACSSRSQSEIVVPLFNGANEIIGVLDVDAEALAQFDDIDARYLNELCTILRDCVFR
ncbi:GAF domain-containing protein [Neisseriaceae bacterium B1]